MTGDVLEVDRNQLLDTTGLYLYATSVSLEEIFVLAVVDSPKKAGVRIPGREQNEILSK